MKNNQFRHLAAVLGMMAMGGACSPPIATAPTRERALPDSSVHQAPKATVPPAPREPDELDDLAASNNAFAFDVFAKLRSSPGNVAFSPLSLSVALTMAYAGARGETAAQMGRVLHHTATLDRVLDLERKLLARYHDPGLKVSLHIASRLFGEKQYTFEQPYMDRMADVFGAPLEPLDFRSGAKSAENSRQRINAWIAGATEDHIKDLLPPQSVHVMTRLVLANAAYFQAGWHAPFDVARTMPAPFRVTAEVIKDVPMMLAPMCPAELAATDGVKVLQMAYEGSPFAMMFVLPDPRDGLAAVEARLSPAAFDTWVAALRDTRVHVSLPKFDIRPAGSRAMGTTLQALGMSLAFDRDNADFTAIAPREQRDGSLYVEEVFHKVLVKVEEKGADAVAASGVVTQAHTGNWTPNFLATHPFLFFIRDTRSGMILFMGHVADPSAP